ncbi:hypothetical protein Gotur_027135 [Gossypium turneri]
MSKWQCFYISFLTTLKIESSSITLIGPGKLLVDHFRMF